MTLFTTTLKPLRKMKKGILKRFAIVLGTLATIVLVPLYIANNLDEGISGGEPVWCDGFILFIVLSVCMAFLYFVVIKPLFNYIVKGEAFPGRLWEDEDDY